MSDFVPSDIALEVTLARLNIEQSAMEAIDQYII